MDRRQLKTRKAIFNAFIDLLKEKEYSDITIQDIIDKADIGRSTFYSHFEYKDLLLKAFCHEIFVHVFNEEIKDECPYIMRFINCKINNNSADNHNNNHTIYHLHENNQDMAIKKQPLKQQLTHTLYHLEEQSEEIKNLLNRDSRDLFLKFFKEHLSCIFSSKIKSTNKDFVLNHFVSSFAETVSWWFKQEKKYTPEEISEMYLSVQNKQFIIID